MKTNRRVWHAAALLALVGMSCARLDPVIPPEATVVTARFDTVTFFETSAVVTVRLSNENPFPVTADGGAFKIILNGAATGRGMSGERVDLPRLGSATVDVPVHINNLGLLLKVPDITSSGRVSYELSSTLYLLHEGRARKVRSRAEGSFVLPAQERDRLSRIARQAAVPPSSGR